MTAATKKAPVQLEPLGEVVSLRPALLRDRDAATYLGRSPSWIRALRAADFKAKGEGRPIAGPAWTTIGASVFYKTTALDAWIAANAVECGSAGFRGGQR